MSPFSNVTSIGDYFLYSCSNLTLINLSPLSNVTSIGDCFLSGCSNLESIIINNEMNECFKNMIDYFINNGINVIYKDNVQFTKFQNDLQKIKTDKEFCKNLLNYLGLQKKGSHKILINQLRYDHKQCNKKRPLNKLPKSRNDQDIFTMEDIKNIPFKGLIFIEEINGAYNAFDVMALRKYLFDKNQKEHINPLTTNKICESDMVNILNVNVRQLNYFIKMYKSQN